MRGSQKWSKEVKERDKHACRRCDVGVGYALHAHHIKPRAIYPEFALVVENGLTLCAGCHKTWHRLLTGKEESPDLHAFMRGFMPGDAKINRQLNLIDGNITNYIDKKLNARSRRVRDEGVSTLFFHLDFDSSSLGEVVPHLISVVDSDNWVDKSDTKNRAIEWLKQATEEIQVKECPNESCPRDFKIPVHKAGATLTCAYCGTSFKYKVERGPSSIRRPNSAAVQAISRYEQRVENKRIEHQAQLRREAEKRESEPREAKRRCEQEIIGKDRSLGGNETYWKNQNDQRTEEKPNSIVNLIITSWVCFVGLCFLVALAGGC